MNEFISKVGISGGRTTASCHADCRSTMLRKNNVIEKKKKKKKNVNRLNRRSSISLIEHLSSSPLVKFVDLQSWRWYDWLRDSIASIGFIKYHGAARGGGWLFQLDVGDAVDGPVDARKQFRLGL